MKIVCIAAALAAGLLLAGCQTMQPASYSNYGDNTFTLRKLTGAKVRIVSMNDLSKFDSGCRMAGPIETAGKRPLAEFIRDSFNDELKFAGLYSDEPDAMELSTTLNSGEFSSMTGLTRGYWTFSLQVSNRQNGKSLTAISRYDFDSGFDAVTACMNTSNALTPAVQRLIYKAVSDPGFPNLVGR
jgi:PBP1b-binding outer membrane lipoprotein LpoB